MASKWDRVIAGGKTVSGKIGKVLDKTVGRGIDAMLRDDSIRTFPKLNAEKRFDAKKQAKAKDKSNGKPAIVIQPNGPAEPKSKKK